MSWTDVKQVKCSVLTTVTPGYARVRGFTIVTKGTGGGEVTFRDCTAAATARIVEEVPTADDLWLSHLIPEAGIRFEGGFIVSVPTSVVVGVYYD